jgi:U3 small nucleolar RNA-associated protein 20
MFRTGHIADKSKKAWESIIGASLSSFNRLCNDSNLGAEETKKFLIFAKRYKSSSHVSLAVAGYLESKYG